MMIGEVLKSLFCIIKSVYFYRNKTLIHTTKPAIPNTDQSQNGAGLLQAVFLGSAWWRHIQCLEPNNRTWCRQTPLETPKLHYSSHCTLESLNTNILLLSKFSETAHSIISYQKAHPKNLGRVSIWALRTDRQHADPSRQLFSGKSWTSLSLRFIYKTGLLVSTPQCCF